LEIKGKQMQSDDRQSKLVLNLRVGDIVEVRSKDEILQTLDENGRLDQLPFMPEMLKYCGKQFKVFKRADKTCDTIEKTGCRRMYNTVHLEHTRCDGQAHGGCEAGCLLFWKEAWLKRVQAETKRAVCNFSLSASINPPSSENRPYNCTEADLAIATRQNTTDGSSDVDVFSCQATELRKATSPLPWWDVRQYVRDVISGNVRLGEFILVTLIAIFNAIQRYRRGRTYPFVPAPKLTQTPTKSLNLNPGEFVQVQSKEEIIATLDKNNKNRGLWFDVEMIRYCGGRFKVLRRVEKIVDEKTGRMLRLPNDCIVLEGVTCLARLSRERLFCPRSITPYWREIWLKRSNVTQ
jgi:hypothetical protein